MGNNCLKFSRTQNEEVYDMVRGVEAIRRMRETFMDSSLEMEKKKKKKKRVLERSESDGGVVRIKVVVSQEELKQILSCEDKELKYSNVEKILECAMKLRGATRISHGREIEGGFTASNWRPALESIPEEH